MRNLKNWPRNSWTLWAMALVLMNCGKPAPIQTSVSMGEDIVRSMGVGRVDLDALRAETKVTVVRGILKRVVFHASILVQKPSSLFIQTTGFGIPTTLVSIAKNKAKIYVPSKNRLFEGDAEDGLNFILPAGFNAQEWIDLLLGAIPEIKRVKDVRQVGEEWDILAQAGREGELTRFSVDEHSGWLNSYELLQRKSKVLFGPPLSTPLGGYPSTIHLQSGKNKILITFEKLETNPKLASELFRFESPKAVNPESIPKELSDEEK